MAARPREGPRRRQRHGHRADQVAAGSGGGSNSAIGVAAPWEGGGRGRGQGLRPRDLGGSRVCPGGSGAPGAEKRVWVCLASHAGVRRDPAGVALQECHPRVTGRGSSAQRGGGRRWPCTPCCLGLSMAEVWDRRWPLRRGRAGGRDPRTPHAGGRGAPGTPLRSERLCRPVSERTRFPPWHRPHGPAPGTDGASSTGRETEAQSGPDSAGSHGRQRTSLARTSKAWQAASEIWGYAGGASYRRCVLPRHRGRPGGTCRFLGNYTRKRKLKVQGPPGPRATPKDFDLAGLPAQAPGARVAGLRVTSGGIVTPPRGRAQRGAVDKQNGRSQPSSSELLPLPKRESDQVSGRIRFGVEAKAEGRQYLGSRATVASCAPVKPSVRL